MFRETVEQTFPNGKVADKWELLGRCNMLKIVDFPRFWFNILTLGLEGLKFLFFFFPHDSEEHKEQCYLCVTCVSLSFQWKGTQLPFS